MDFISILILTSLKVERHTYTSRIVADVTSAKDCLIAALACGNGDQVFPTERME